MTTKTICVLANSIKFGGRCIAGMEVTPTSDKKWKLSQDWVRPISHRDGGALSTTEIQFEGSGNEPKLGDIVEIYLDEPAHVAGQPEDWLITKNQRWQRKGYFKWDVLQKLVQNPDHLWLEDKFRPDRVSPAYLGKKGMGSLYLIEPENFQLAVWKETFNGTTKLKRRGTFDYKGTSYDLSLTDPLMQEKYFSDLRTRPEGPVKPGPTNVKAVCISLAPEFKEQKAHFKLVAAVFE